MEGELAVGVLGQRLLARAGVEALVLQRVRQLVDDDHLAHRRGIDSHPLHRLRHLGDRVVNVVERVVKRQHLRLIEVDELGHELIGPAVDELERAQHQHVVVERVRHRLHHLRAEAGRQLVAADADVADVVLEAEAADALHFVHRRGQRRGRGGRRGEEKRGQKLRQAAGHALGNRARQRLIPSLHGLTSVP